MRRIPFLVAAMFIGVIGLWAAKPSVLQEPSKDTQANSSNDKIPQEEIDRKNPVKPTPEGLAAARRVYSYDCAMCHGANGDGKGDLVETMKLTVHDWRDASSIADKTDGELFYIIMHGRAKMEPEKGRASDTMCWDLVNLIRSFSKKEGAEKRAS